MAQFSNDTVERVKEAADIVEIVSAYTDLRRAGERYQGLCPFHEERTGSFSVDPREKLYHCFGCGVGGDVISFVIEKEGLAFPDAIEALADRYGVEVERAEEDPRAEEARRRRARLQELLERTAVFYTGTLWDADEARKAREYLLGRGFGEEVLRRFGVGYAPSAWDTVLMRGQRAGYSTEELLGAGLAQRSEKARSGLYDFFRARITFPIRDARGRMQGFGARAMTEGRGPKYKNSREGDLYRKSRTVYAIDLARPAIAKRGRAVVMEGYTDVIAAHQAGIEEAVAVMGTAITPEQVRTLSQHCELVVLAMDADRAGREAMLRAQRVAQGKRVVLRVAALEPGSDPADVLTKGGEEAAKRFAAALDDAVDLPVFHVRTLLDEGDLSTPAGRDAALEEAAPVIAAMPDSITRSELVREVSDRLRASPELVERRVVAGRGGIGEGARPAPIVARPDDGRGANGAARPGESGRALNAVERRERKLLAMCIALPNEGAPYLRRLKPEHLSSAAMERARLWLLDHLEDPREGLPREEDGELHDIIAQLVMESGLEPATKGSMELNYLQLEQARLERAISEARSTGEIPQELMSERAAVVERISGGA